MGRSIPWLVSIWNHDPLSTFYGVGEENHIRALRLFADLLV